MLARSVILILSTPVLQVTSWHLKRMWRKGTSYRRNIAEKGMSLICRKLYGFRERFCLPVVAEIPSHAVRNFYYRHVFFADIAKDVVIYHGCEMRKPERLTIGRGSIVGDNAILDARYGLSIGENVNISSRASIWTMQHDYNDPMFDCTEAKCGPVTIGDRAWIGPNTLILPCRTIGRGAVVGGGAVVTRDVPDYAVVAGVPAKPVATRSRDLRYEFDGRHPWFL